MNHNKTSASTHARQNVAPVVMLELNELNFRWVEHYAENGHLPEFKRLFSEHKVFETASEEKYENIEPWIQWLSAHTGMAYEEHGIFRLGDAVGSDIKQIWGVLENHGVSVGAVSPMNAENDLKKPAYFIPDPWTETEVSGSFSTRVLFDAVKTAVNANAGGKFGVGTYAGLLLGAARYARPNNWKSYVELSLGSKGRPWRKAIFLDRLLADVFLALQKTNRAQFTTLFLNAGAHTQHHYMFNSPLYEGEHKNPSWYVHPDDDPVLEVYRCYDGILGDIRRHFPKSRLLIFTGLHQDPYPHLVHYWRLKNHAEFLQSAGLSDFTVSPRMSRDFLIEASSSSKLDEAAQILTDARIDGSDTAVFDVDHRGQSLFVTLSWPDDIPSGCALQINGSTLSNFRDALVFVAIKNGHHNSIGYGIDTADPPPTKFAIKDVYHRILDHFVSSPS